MLKTLSRKIFPMMSLAIVTVACGKKIEEQKKASVEQTHNQEMSSVYSLRLDGSESSRKSYVLPKAAQFQIPQRIRVHSGSPLNKLVEIAFDVNEFDHDDFHFKCSYKGKNSINDEMILSHCEDYDGYAFDVDRQIFPQRKGSIIQIRFAGPSASDMVVEAVFGMTWI